MIENKTLYCIIGNKKFPMSEFWYDEENLKGMSYFEIEQEMKNFVRDDYMSFLNDTKILDQCEFRFE